MSERDQLIIPASAQSDSKAFEVLRVWVANGGQHVSIRADVWDDVGNWGILLADLAGHVANAYQQQKGLDRARALERIKDLFNAELSFPTDTPAGKVL
jgi:Domain of unknown function (DUF5076)